MHHRFRLAHHWGPRKIDSRFVYGQQMLFAVNVALCAAIVSIGAWVEHGWCPNETAESGHRRSEEEDGGESSLGIAALRRGQGGGRLTDSAQRQRRDPTGARSGRTLFPKSSWRLR